MRVTWPLAHGAASGHAFLRLEVERGRAVFQGAPKPEHCNPLGTIHGGWSATLLDSCMACAVHTTLPAGQGR
jgi:acyl-coenzyme A thioesterase PaaI-like protein